MILSDIENSDNIFGVYFNCKLNKFNKIRSFNASNFFEKKIKCNIICNNCSRNIYKNKIKAKAIIKQKFDFSWSKNY